MTRVFRSEESYREERKTRGMVASFLSSRGFSNVTDKRVSFGREQSQTLLATDSKGVRYTFWVRLCWRRGGQSSKGGPASYSAAQLMAGVQGDDWIGTLRRKMAKEEGRGMTHLLLVQRQGRKIVLAAAVPIRCVVPIWRKQRDVSDGLIRSGKFESRKKNHAMNGRSPTIWLQDDRAPRVAAALWDYLGVLDLRHAVEARTAEVDDDSLNDLPGIDYSNFGSDGARRQPGVTSGVRRDPRVRRIVLQRSRGICERPNCGASRDYAGFLDVHHILGADNSDRVWNCVALCPSCHRDAHFSPRLKHINSQLLTLVSRYRHSPGRILKAARRMIRAVG